jgi:hypothetical protein
MKHGKNGSYTVEAAFIVPLALGIAFVILYTLFLLHDRVILQANLNNVLCRMAEEDGEGETTYDSVLKQSLWCMEIKTEELSDGAFWIKGSVSAGASWEIPVLSVFIDKEQTVSLSESYGNVQPEEIIRYGLDFMKKKDTETKQNEDDKKKDAETK